MSDLDVGRLKEALEGLPSEADYRSRGFPVNHKKAALVAAARLVAAGRPLWWCEEHNSEVCGDLAHHCRVVAFAGWSAVPCRMVAGWWMPTGKDET